MSDIKFACAACGQKIKCDSSHAGLRIPCPGCGDELEIPKVEPAANEEGSAPRQNLEPAPVPPQPAVNQAP